MKATRRLVQFAFLALTLYGVFIFEGHTERWCPFGGVEAAYQYVTEGNLTCSLGVSNFYILGAVLLMTLLARRVFCGYVCPVGTISEWVQLGGRRLGLRPLTVPPTLDRALSLLKYPVLVIILYITWRAGELLFRGFDPCYALISRHGKDITFWAYVVSGGILLFSLFLMIPFCRWLCPLAAVLNPLSRFGLLRIKRSDTACIDCGVCARACPMAIPVDKVRTVTHARCTGCLDCVAACPKVSAGALAGGPFKTLGAHGVQLAIIGVVLACLGGAVAATYAFPLPSFIQARGEPPATTDSVRLTVSGVTCRHSSMEFAAWLDRRDLFEVPGYLKLEVWPAPAGSDVRITFDPTRTSADDIRAAIVSPLFDFDTGTIERSPYEIEGYRPTLE